MTCHNCAIPQGATSKPGRSIQITLRAENGYQRNRKSTVWVCSDDCAYQALAISKYGPATFRWPISLAKFRSITKLAEPEPETPKKRLRTSRKAKNLVWARP